MRVDQELIVKSATLARSSPQMWSEFLVALKSYSDDASRLCVASPLEQLPRMQGKAQQCAELTTLFEGACKAADRIANPPAGASAAVRNQ